MQVCCVIQIVSVVVILVAFVQAKNEETPKNMSEIAISKNIDPVSLPNEEDSDAIRKKKSATTTLCVEIRPSGPYQRPFQICEPAESKPYAPAPAAGPYYSAPSYEEVKPVAPVTSKPAPAYEAPTKTYAVPAKPTSAPAYASSKPYAAHSPSSYSSVSYRSEDGSEDLMEEPEDEEHSDEVAEQLVRSAFQEYGVPMTYMKPAYKHKQKKGHNGLVITCQPSLAGYAATLPSYGGAYGGVYGGYRSSTARSYNRYERPPPHRPSYPNYAPAPPASYKTPPTYKIPAPSYPAYKAPAPSYSSYKAPAPSYSAYKAPAPSYNTPVYRPAPVYSAPPPVYSAPSPVYSAPHPTYSPPQKPVYASAPAAPVYTQPSPQAYNVVPQQPSYAYLPSQTYAPVPPPPPPPAPMYTPKPHPPPVYTPPAAYRAADDASQHHVTADITTEIPTQEEKEKHTIRTMSQIAESRSSTGSKTEHQETHVEMPEPRGWSQLEDDDHKTENMMNDAEEMRGAWEKSSDADINKV